MISYMRLLDHIGKDIHVRDIGMDRAAATRMMDMFLRRKQRELSRDLNYLNDYCCKRRCDRRDLGILCKL